jgi:hypothetical protein
MSMDESEHQNTAYANWRSEEIWLTMAKYLANIHNITADKTLD